MANVALAGGSQMQCVPDKYYNYFGGVNDYCVYGVIPPSNPLSIYPQCVNEQCGFSCTGGNCSVGFRNFLYSPESNSNVQFAVQPNIFAQFIMPNSLSTFHNENNVTCSVPDVRTTYANYTIYDLIAINSGCDYPCTVSDTKYLCTCSNASQYENVKGVSYNVACVGYGQHFGQYAEPQNFYPNSCDNAVNALVTPVPGLFQILYNSFTFVTPDLTVQSLTTDEISQVLGWACYDYNAKQQETLFSNTKRNCPRTLEQGNTLFAWSQPLNQFNSESIIPYKDFMCCAQNNPASPSTPNCSYQTSCWDSPYCAKILYSTCSTNMRLPFTNSVSVLNSSLGTGLSNGLYLNLGNAFTIPYDWNNALFYTLTATLSGILAGVPGYFLSDAAIWYLTKNNNIITPIAEYILPAPTAQGTFNFVNSFVFSAAFNPGDTINMIFYTGGANVPNFVGWTNVQYDFNGLQFSYSSAIPNKCNNWLDWAQGQTSQTNAPSNITGMKGAYDLSADAAFQSVVDYCLTTNSNNCVGISLTNYAQIFPRTPFLLFNDSYNTSNPYQVVVPFKNVFFKSITALLVVDGANASFNLDNISPRSITLGPLETAAFSVTLAEVVSSYSTSPGWFQKITTQSNWPWYPAFGGTRTDLGPSCNEDGLNLNPTISDPINTATYEAISPPLCNAGDTDISGSVPLPPGAISIIDPINGDYIGVSYSSSFSGPFFSNTGLSNNPFGYDCANTLILYEIISMDFCFDTYYYLFYPYYGFKPICWWPSVTLFPAHEPIDTYLGCAKENQIGAVYNIATTPGWPSCDPLKTIYSQNIIPYSACEGAGGSQHCQYDSNNPPNPAFRLPLLSPFDSCYNNQTPGYYPIGPNGICDPFIQNNASYTTVRVCQSTNIGGQFLNFYIQDVSLGQTNTNQSNRTTNSLDFPILGGFLATVGPDTTSNILSATRAYAYGFSLDSLYSQFFGV